MNIFARGTSMLIVGVICLALNTVNAKEGMWIPTLLNALEGDMQAMGLRLSAEDIYSVNHSSLKDAVVHFGGGCTAEMVSPEGLLLTNHHCGYSQIQYHSSVANDYLKNGFWAMSRADELPNPGLTATFIDRIHDVTERVEIALKGLEGEELSAKRKSLYAEILAEFTDGTDLTGGVVSFDFGNQHFLITKRTFLDIRLVGAPPSAVGKFGGDTDNWLWPRHTGDFSVFRIYASSENNPAEYSADNVPYSPAHHFPVSLDGVVEGDFTMIFGFPGRTEQYLSSDAVTHVIDRLNPMRIAMRDVSLATINAARASSDALRIAYASKQSSISNAWKKWEGQTAGLKELHAVQKKLDLEAEFLLRAQAAEVPNPSYINAINSIQKANESYFPFYEARSLFIELVYYGPDLLLHAFEFADLIENWDELEDSGKLNETIDHLLEVNSDYSRNYNASVDEDLLGGLVSTYLDLMPESLTPSNLKASFIKAGSSKNYASTFFKNSVFDNPDELAVSLRKGKAKSFAKLERDPAYALVKELRSNYFEQISPGYRSGSAAIKTATATYTQGLRELFPNRLFPIDANSTLRLTYGKVEGSSPHDGMNYEPLTTARGILQKYTPGDPDFDLPIDLVADLSEGDWGRYADSNDDLVICFTGSNHTTGGNSGSPVINGDGYLVGINFDRSWESTMSDILFDESRCRNIMVDIRYVLWIIDKYAGAGHLVDEMTIIDSAD
ncbi:MAG TPA: S46 family peptidase [Flavobacteriales bacterium]|nr:S46 family peptidase [Flavobacteriales bacterium]